MIYNLDFHTNYNQFYICDKDSLKNTGSSSFWTTEAYNDRLAIEEGILGVGIESYGHVKGEIIILNCKPAIIDIDQSDHIVEGGIEIKSGILQILDCPSSTLILEVPVKSGNYCVRISSSALADVDIDEYEGTDIYKVKVWPDNETERKVLKRYIRK